MLWRVIVRFSLNADRNSHLRNAVANFLTGHGIARTATGTWESQALNSVTAADCLAQVLAGIADPPGSLGIASNVHLDHLWVYLDHVPNSNQPREASSASAKAAKKIAANNGLGIKRVKATKTQKAT